MPHSESIDGSDGEMTNRNVTMWRMLSAAGLFVAAMAGGCGVGAIYNDPQGSMVGYVSPRTEWAISGDLPNARTAVDGDVGTFTVSGPSYSNSQLTIDLGRPCLFNMVVVDHGPNRDGYPARLGVLTSGDGKEFVFRHAAPGCRRVTTLLLLTPVLARYVRIQALQEGRQPWSVAEVYLQ